MGSFGKVQTGCFKVSLFIAFGHLARFSRDGVKSAKDEIWCICEDRYGSEARWWEIRVWSLSIYHMCGVRSVFEVRVPLV